MMDDAPDDEIEIQCNGVKLMSGKMGGTKDHVAISLSEIFNRNIRELV